MSVRDELYIEELHASVNELEQELETAHRANKMLSDEKEKNRQEYIKLYQKLEAIRSLCKKELEHCEIKMLCPKWIPTEDCLPKCRFFGFKKVLEVLGDG